MKIFQVLLAIVFFISISSCASEEVINTTPKYDRGIFVINQGAFGAGTGTVTFTDGDTMVEQNVFQRNNMGEVLGNVAQSMIKVGNNYFIAINNGGKVVKTDRLSFKEVDEITGLAQPRYFAKYREETIYLSEWGADGISGQIHKIDSETGNILRTIPTLGGPEEMVIVDRHLYIAKSGGFGSDSLLLKYNIDTDKIEESYTVGHNPINIEVDRIGTLWILCTGLFDFTDPSGNTSGSLVQWDNGQIIQSVALDNGVGNLTMDKINDILYFTMSGKIMKFDMRDGSMPEEFYDGFYYSLAVDASTGDLYAADAKDFSSNGEVLVFRRNGELKASFSTGVIPGFIYFAD